MQAIRAAFPRPAPCRSIVATVMALAVSCLPVPAIAQSASEGALATTPARAAQVTGFRSAHFGMTEDAVRAAAAADFAIDPDALMDGINTVERTRVLTALVPGVLPEGGTAQLSYIFGYRSKALIQVGLLWNAGTDPDLTPDTIAANGDVLQAHFLNAGHVAETVSVDTILDGGILLYSGADAEGRSVILLLQGRFADDVPGRLPLTATSLTLLYAEDPENPDIFRIGDGEF